MPCLEYCSLCSRAECYSLSQRMSLSPPPPPVPVSVQIMDGDFSITRIAGQRETGFSRNPAPTPQQLLIGEWETTAAWIRLLPLMKEGLVCLHTHGAVPLQIGADS